MDDLSEKVEQAFTPKTLWPEDLTGSLAILTGTRPGIIKFSPILRELDRRGKAYLVIHSGQHYSPEMDAVFFKDLGLKEPTYKLDVVRHYSLHGEQTAEMLKGIEQILLRERPWMLLVGGDCNTHLAGALAARKLHIPIGHVEAGMRSFDWRMPEEHNRVIIDHIAEHLFVHGQTAQENLARESVRGVVHVVGTTISDAVAQNLEIARERSNILEQLRLSSKCYLLATVHREENVDRLESLRAVLQALDSTGLRAGQPMIFPVHPRTWKRIREFGLEEWVSRLSNLRIIKPLGYLDFLRLLAESRLFLTDSGGGQQESCILHVPCVTLRDATEWVETVEVGANRLTGADPQRIVAASEVMLQVELSWLNPFGDGHAAFRIVDVLEILGRRGAGLGEFVRSQMVL